MVSASPKEEDTEDEIRRYLDSINFKLIEIRSDLEAKKREIEELNKESERLQSELSQRNEKKKDITHQIDILSTEKKALEQEYIRRTRMLSNLIPKQLPETVSTSDDTEERKFRELQEKEFRVLLENIMRKLRKCIHSDQVMDEKQIQDALDSVLSVLDIPFNRENVGIPIATKMRKPDFVLKDTNIAIEVKLLEEKKRLGKIIDEIGADKQAYKKAYGRLVFVIYDHGVIQNPEDFIKDLEDSTTSVIIVKH